MTTSQLVDWSALQHAYGNASDVPALLEQITLFPHEENWQSEPWFSLWSALYHQGDIYSASIAAVPVIVSTLAVAPERATMSFYLLPTSIAIADSTNPIDLAQEIRTSFNSAVATLGQLASCALPEIKDSNITTAAQAAILVLQGAYSRAEQLLDADA